MTSPEDTNEQNKLPVVGDDQEELKLPVEMPLLPIRDIVVYPYTILPLFVGREKSVKAVEEALAKGRIIFLVTQKSANVDRPEPDHLYKFGTISMIMRLLKLPDGRVKILIQGLMRAELIEYIQTEPYYKVKVKKLPETRSVEMSLESEALMRTIRSQLEEAVSLGKAVIPDVVVIANNISDPGRLADLVISNLNLKTEDSQNVLEIIDAQERLRRVSELLSKEIEVLNMQHKIQVQAKEEIDKNQREYYLRQQLKAIQQELGDVDERTEEIKDLRRKIEEAKMPEAVEKEAKKQLGRLSRMHPDAAEAGMVYNYLDWLQELPWSISTEDKLNIKQAQQVLDEDHYDLKKVKERILEYLAVRKLNQDMKGPILCFVGPPGVGKTSLGKSISRALGRKFVRMSLGGVRDEAEIRGHRRTYIGSMPGRIIQGLKQAGSNNPVFMLDEVDKVGADFRGDPSAALLEVLDPEQNSTFSDHYLGVPFDLSKVMFITTANLLDPILPAFRDRMETIHLTGYTEEEKLHIAKQYLLPRQLKENGINDKIMVISDKAILSTISAYTREAGVRNLERELANLCRKVAKKIAEGDGKNSFRITVNNLDQYLGPIKYLRETESKSNEVGVVTGLAWTESGGDIIHVEATTMKGKGNLILTGHLGDVMKESAQAALSYIRSKSVELGIDEGFYAQNDIHIHVPAGAIPKDGPSAGITMATALVSALTRIPVRRDVAMTGEITLRGKVLPIGGLKEKVLAARRAGIYKVVIPLQNKKDLQEIPANVSRKMEFIFSDMIDSVLEAAMTKRVFIKSAKSEDAVASVGR
jgi:ATP-dependent Lon protease